MIIFADYEFYKSVGGELDERSFQNLAAKASAYIDKVTFGRASEHADDERVKRCCCDLCDSLSAISGGVKQSESAGSWSVTYANSENTSESNYARAACRVWLPADWLYRGVGRE
ncbi:MAG: hypothetical protein K2N56_10025 [Oscillospiraceae bacterium]|nr:hypothetical protein [Oscillospiraceae bacterium]